MAFIRGANVATDGLVLALDAANPKSYVSGSTVWNNLADNGNNGTLINGPTFSSNNGGTLVFDGIDDYVNFTNNNVNYNSGEITINAVVYPRVNSAQFGMPIIVQSTDCDRASFALLWGRTANKFSWFAVNSTVVSTSNLNINNWYNITAIRKTIGVDLYINGVLNASTINSGNGIGSSKSLSIGDPINCEVVSNWNGNISIVNLYNRALSPIEVLQNYNATKARFNLD